LPGAGIAARMAACGPCGAAMSRRSAVLRMQELVAERLEDEIDADSRG
jgi:hypothetical protein